MPPIDIFVFSTQSIISGIFGFIGEKTKRAARNSHPGSPVMKKMLARL
jgi:hypothetical protein